MKNSSYLIVISFVLLPLFSLAVKQISFILINGSIFEPFRRKINKKFNSSKNGFTKSFWKKINELLACNLCLTAQVSIWVIAMPFFTVLYLNNHHFLINYFDLKIDYLWEISFNLFVIFIFSMAVSALAYGFWILLEYPYRKIEIEKHFSQNLLEIESLSKLSNVKAKSDKGNNNVGKSVSINDFTLRDFNLLIRVLDTECSNIDCGVGRKNCRETEAQKFVQDWYDASGADDVLLLYNLKRKVKNALRKYFSNGEDTEELKKSIYKEEILR